MPGIFKFYKIQQKFLKNWQTRHRQQETYTIEGGKSASPKAPAPIFGENLGENTIMRKVKNSF